MSPFQVLLAKHGRHKRFHLHPRAAAWLSATHPRRRDQGIPGGFGGRKL